MPCPNLTFYPLASVSNPHFPVSRALLLVSRLLRCAAAHHDGEVPVFFFEPRTTLKRLSPVTGLKRFNVVRRLLLVLCSFPRIRDFFL
jgi:hypothetical protein